MINLRYCYKYKTNINYSEINMLFLNLFFLGGQIIDQISYFLEHISFKIRLNLYIERNVIIYIGNKQSACSKTLHF